MSKFIELTYADREEKFFLNVDCIEYFEGGSNGSIVVTPSHDTKIEEFFEVRETPAEITAKIQEVQG